MLCRRKGRVTSEREPGQGPRKLGGQGGWWVLTFRQSPSCCLDGLPDLPERQDMAGPRGPRPAVHTSVH